MSWAQRLKRVFAIDIVHCRGCGGRLKVIASIEALALIERTLDPEIPGQVMPLMRVHFGGCLHGVPPESLPLTTSRPR